MDYSEIVMEAALRSGAPEVPARAEHFVRQAERDLEKVLRVRQMEFFTTITSDANGAAPLPSNFLAPRQPESGSIVIVGGNVYMAPNQTTRLPYFARLPSIADVPSNWLSEAEPEIYINAVLVQIYSATADQRLAAAASVLAERVGGLIREDKIARYNGRLIDAGRLAL